MEAVAITHPEKVLFPNDGITKGELVSYYETVAPAMLYHLRGRPVTMERFHRGIAEKGFFQKDLSKGFPAWLERVEVPKKDGSVHHPLANDTRSLLWLANQNCITMHVWISRAPRLYYPDLCIFDLDPLQENSEVLRSMTLALRDLLHQLGFSTWVKTTGSKGFHIAVPLSGEDNFGEVAHFANVVGRTMVNRHPEHLTQEFSKADRGGRILVDTGRNAYSATFAAAYTVRPKPGAPVSAPCSWNEVERGTVAPQTFHVRNMTARLAESGDLWAGIHEHGISLRGPMERLRSLNGK
jgi:bifunctional non-homologous end joining protein LigD